MKIKYCSSKKDSDCPCKDYNEYEIKLKCMKTKLHSRYIACIAVGIIIWLLATGQANTKEFSAWISFASTVTSIILSVIAIIMSITEENKTEVMRNQMEETSRKLEEAAKAIEKANEDNIKNIKELKENIHILEEKVEELKGETVEVLNRYEKTTNTDRDAVKYDINDNLEWGDNIAW